MYQETLIKWYRWSACWLICVCT